MQTGNDCSSCGPAYLNTLADACQVFRCIDHHKIAVHKPGCIANTFFFNTREIAVGAVQYGLSVGVNITVMNVLNRSVFIQVGTWIGGSGQTHAGITKSPRFPVAVEARQANLASKKLLHCGLLDCVLLGDQRLQSYEQPIHVRQRLHNGMLLGRKWKPYFYCSNIVFADFQKGRPNGSLDNLRLERQEKVIQKFIGYIILADERLESLVRAHRCHGNLDFSNGCATT